MSDTSQTSVGSTLCTHQRSEELMLQEATVREMLARLARGEGIKTITRELGVDRKDKQGSCLAIEH